MNSLKCNVQCDRLDKYNDTSFRNSTVTTEVSSSTATESRRSLDSTDVHPSMDKDGVELLLDDTSCKSECSRLTSDHESTRKARTNTDSISSDNMKQHYSAEYPCSESDVYALLYDDSFFYPCEVDVGSLDDDSDSTDDELHGHTPIQRRGRSMSIEEHPRWRRKHDTSSLTPSKQNYKPKKCSVQVRRSSSLPPKEHVNRILEVQTNGDLSRFARSKRRPSSPRRIVTMRCPRDQQPYSDENHHGSDEKPLVKLPSVRTTTTSTEGHSRKKINKLESSCSVPCDFPGIPSRGNGQKLSRNCSFTNDVDVHAILHQNNTPVQTPNYGVSFLERVHLCGLNVLPANVNYHKEIPFSRKKGKALNRSLSLQSEGDYQRQHSHIIDTVQVTSKRQMRRSKENDLSSPSSEPINAGTNGRLLSPANSSCSDRTNRNPQVRDDAPVRTSEFLPDIPGRDHDDRHHSNSHPKDTAKSTVNTNNPQGMKEFKGRRPSRNRSTQSEIDASDIPALLLGSSRRYSSIREYRDEKEAVAQPFFRHRSVSPQTKNLFLRPVSNAGSLISTSTSSQSPLDKTLPNFLDSQQGIVLHGCKPYSQRSFDGNEMPKQSDLDRRWRVEAHHLSPRRPSRQLNESEQNSSLICRNIKKFQSFPESPSRRTRTLHASADNFSILAQCDNEDTNKPKMCMQPNIGKNQSSKASPLRYQSPVKPGSSVTHHRRRSNSIDDVFQQQDGPWKRTEHHPPSQRVETQPSATSNNSSPMKPSKYSAADNFKNRCTTEQDEYGRRYVAPAFSEAVRKTPAKRSSDSKRFL